MATKSTCRVNEEMGVGMRIRAPTAVRAAKSAAKIMDFV